MSGTPFVIHTLAGYIESIFLIAYPDKLLLLDSGCSCDVPMVMEFIKNTLNRSRKDLRAVIVTHPHPDHFGGAHVYQQMGIPVHSVRDINNWYGGITGWFTQQVDIALTHYVAYKRQTAKEHIGFPRQMTLDHILTPHQSIWGFEDWVVIPTPGHTTLDISLWHAASRTMYIGDCIVHTGKKYVTPYPITAPDDYTNSLQQIAVLNPETVLLAHHGPHHLDSSIFSALIETVPEHPKTHRSTVRKWLGLA